HWHNNADVAIRNALRLIDLLKNKTTDILEKEFLFKNMTVLQQLQQLNDKTGYINNIITLHQLYKQLIKTEKLSFRGEPLSGLQIMGMLETRVLDFENVILTSVNEGILPAGKTDNSFIPFDVKKDPRINLPTYQERDAIFSYHFHRLIQRAKNIYLLYNTENDQYGSGEQSRFITELEIKKVHEIEKYVVSPKVSPQNIELKKVIKSKPIISRLHELAIKGLSPTSLTHYINNPIGFYQEKILGIKELEEAEETIASNTLGTIIHKTLESLYTPLKNTFLKKEHILAMRKMVENEVLMKFTEVYKNGDISSGKNLLIYNVAQQFISNFLDQELRLISLGSQLKILELEYDLESEFVIEESGMTVKLIGQADRIDELDGTIRIIDYKTGKAAQNDLMVKDWNLISKDYKYSKAFQVLFYALLYSQMHGADFDRQPLESGIISFKNLNAGFLKVNRNTISNQDLGNFITELKRLISEIFETSIPFIENENKYF
ncbi:MAG: PD-(D/E)XK nuclease family protein, partial [Flavobacteriaceae bacterium]|nr:PD-(D/E)XK nuclease family protein [Flavobacteriaceae bacterium]